ncbi:hypothetical protein NECAME_05921 [Necator americanus]|uniref:Uncharacterized protein n=1 Tax=Necator americanus TaxID=51031 RepID=W2TZP9_NECAM|nr:hypothetical protein NECAME_05921 [Necator americanus]ETN86517.1 hypothetical protein NECAME_05921 [Necator americanus]
MVELNKNCNSGSIGRLKVVKECVVVRVDSLKRVMIINTVVYHAIMLCAGGDHLNRCRAPHSAPPGNRGEGPRTSRLHNVDDSTALLRSIKLCREVPSTKVELLGPMRTKVTMTVGDLTAEVVACGSKVGQQRAAQNLLKQIHPQVSTYGGLLRIYANPDEKEEQRETRKLQAELVQLQNQTKGSGDTKKPLKSKSSNSDNSKSAALQAREKAEKARERMEKLKDKASEAKELAEKLKIKAEKAKRAADRAASRSDREKARAATAKWCKVTDQYKKANKKASKLKSLAEKATKRYKQRQKRAERPVEKKRWERIRDKSKNNRSNANEAVLALLRKEMARIKERTTTRSYMYATKPLIE